MSDMIRKQLYITKKQDMYLKERAKDLGITEAELVRNALDSQRDNFRYTRQPFSVWEQEKTFINELAKQTDMKKERTWKRDELYDE